MEPDAPQLNHTEGREIIYEQVREIIDTYILFNKNSPLDKANVEALILMANIKPRERKYYLRRLDLAGMVPDCDEALRLLRNELIIRMSDGFTNTVMTMIMLALGVDPPKKKKPGVLRRAFNALAGPGG